MGGRASGRRAAESIPRSRRRGPLPVVPLPRRGPGQQAADG